MKGKRRMRLRKPGKKGKKQTFKPKPTPPPEDTLAALPLVGGGLPGPMAVKQADAGWKSILHDEHRRTFVAHRSGAFPSGLTSKWWDDLKAKIAWRRPVTEDLALPRSAAWLTADGCTCRYEYSGLEFDPLPMSPWFREITDKVCETCGLLERPNSCNANYYESGAQSVGWHSDDEPLFQALQQDVLIVSLSLGATRTFELASKDKPTEVIQLALQDGDLCTMEGLCQKHYRHRVARERSVLEPRINLTWRWLLQHQDRCPQSKCAAQE